MEKICEFCKELSAIVYCKSDAAHLCLSCDAKIHSANTLSYQHHRTIVCECCKYQPAFIRCLDHQMFMCHSCDTSYHVSIPHQKKVISCYVGCPGAKDLATFWELDLNEIIVKGQGGSNKWQQNRHLILQQILDLERFQLSVEFDSSCPVHFKGRATGSPLLHDTMLELHEDIDSQMHQFVSSGTSDAIRTAQRRLAYKSNHNEHFGGRLEFQHSGSPQEDETEESSLPSFSPLEQLASSGNPLHGDSFWHCKSPAQNNETWLQNMQDLGVCDDVQCSDDINIPDVDLTFWNFEEIFESDHELQADHNDKEKDCPDRIQRLQTINQCPHSIRTSCSASSFSISRLSGESSGSEYKDDGFSPTSLEHLLPLYPKNTELDVKENIMMRYKEKKVLRHEKQDQYTSPKPKPDGKKW